MADEQHATRSRTDYTVRKGEVSLAVYRKRIDPAPGEPPRPVLFLVHGSSNSALSSFDLTVPGTGEYSTMNVFAGPMIRSIFTRDHPGTSDPAVAQALADADQTGHFPPLQRTP